MRRVPVHAGGGQQQAAEVRGGGQVHAVRLPEDRLSDMFLEAEGGFHVILIFSICLFKFL